jgi:VanZ family protein
LYAGDVRTPVPPSFDDRPGRAEAPQRWQRRSSPLSRYALAVYVLIVIDASLYPFGGWRDLGIAPFDYLYADWPRHALPFDLVVNAVGYAPLGFLAGLALHPKLRGVAAVVVAVLLCAAMSLGMEAIQTYLPARVASKVDVASNVTGGSIGAVLAVRAAHVLLDTGRLRMWRTRWFNGDASRGLVLMLVWFGALVYPDAFVFGTGGLLKIVDPDAARQLASVAGFASDVGPVSSASRFELAEATVSALTLLGTGMLFFNLQRDSTRWTFRIGLLGVFVTATVGVATLAHAFLFEQAAPWPPLSPGARSGIAVAAALLVVVTPLPRRMRWSLAIAALAGALALVNIYPDNPYVNAVGRDWTRGKLMNFYGLASGVNLVWPFAAIGYLLRHAGASPARRRPRPVAAKVASAPPL